MAGIPTYTIDQKKCVVDCCPFCLNVSMDATRPMQENKLRAVLEVCRSSFISIGLFSALVNVLALAPIFYMIQITGRVVTSSSASTLVMLTLILTVLLFTMSSLELVRSLILVRIGNRMDALLSRDAYRSSFKHALTTGGANSTANH